MKTYYEEYEKIKDKGKLISGYTWRNMSEEEQQNLLSEKTVITCVGTIYAGKMYQIEGNVNNLTNEECAIIADKGNLCFGFRMEDKKIVIYTD
jgi:hypothetical protein